MKKILTTAILSLSINNFAIAEDISVNADVTISALQLDLTIIHHISFGELKTGNTSASTCAIEGDNDLTGNSCDLLSGTPQHGEILAEGQANESIQVSGTSDTQNSITYTPKFGAPTEGLDGDTILTTNLDATGELRIKVLGNLTYDPADITHGLSTGFQTTVSITYN